ncbi:MAG: hypothetical protein ACI4Q4_05185 [Oscillospiraceae bacterium]
MNVKNITLTGGEVAVTIPGRNCAIRNDGAATIYASCKPSIVAGADGVVSIPACAAVNLKDAGGTVYIKGTGAATCAGMDDNVIPFKSTVTPGSVTEEIQRAVSCPNLLINPDFAINQRGKSAYTSGEVSVDCWKCNNITLSVNDGAVFLAKADGVSQGELVQSVEGAYSSLAGKAITISCSDADGNIITGTGTIPTEQPTVTTALVTASLGNVWITFSWSAAAGRFYFRIWLRGSAELTYSPAWCKVEVGEFATPFVPRLYAEELALCQRFYQIHSTGDIAAVDLRPNMATIKDIVQREDGNYGYIADV